MAKDKLDKVISDVDKELTKNKKETTKVKNKAPKTIKVSTVIKIQLVIVAIVLSFLAGWFSNILNTKNHDNQVKSEAKALVTELKQSGK